MATVGLPAPISTESPAVGISECILPGLTHTAHHQIPASTQACNICWMDQGLFTLALVFLRVCLGVEISFVYNKIYAIVPNRKEYTLTLIS